MLAKWEPPPGRGREETPGFDVEIEYGNTWNKNSGIELDLAWRICGAMLDGKATDPHVLVTRVKEIRRLSDCAPHG